MKKWIMVLVIGLSGLLSGCAMEDSEEYVGVSDYSKYEPTVNITYIDPSIALDISGEGYATILENAFITTYSVSTFGVDVDTASYSNIRRMLFDEIMPTPDAVRIEEMLNYFDYYLEAPTGDDDIAIYTEISQAPWNTEHDLLLVGLKGKEVIFEEAPANNLVFLLDVSGSMDSYNKLGLLKEAMTLLVDQIRPNDRISIVVYAGAAGLVLDGADGGDADEIISAINHLSAGGSTAGGAGIELAYSVAEEYYIEGGNNRIILATDGDFNVGISSIPALEELIAEKRETGVFLSVLGFGTGNLRDDIMETLADAGNGVYHYIDSQQEAEKVFVQELAGSLINIAKDVKLQIEFNPMTVKGYRLIGYENRMLNYEDFDNDAVDTGDMGAGHEVIALYEIIPAGSTEEVDQTTYEQPDDARYDGENHPDEYLYMAIRYKDPDADTSQLIDHVLYVSEYTNAPSETFLFATSIAEFGLLLRDSEYKGDASYDAIIARAQSALGDDEYGWRAQFVQLVQIAQTLHE